MDSNVCSFVLFVLGAVITFCVTYLQLWVACLVLKNQITGDFKAVQRSVNDIVVYSQLWDMTKDEDKEKAICIIRKKAKDISILIQDWWDKYEDYLPKQMCVEFCNFIGLVDTWVFTLDRQPNPWQDTTMLFESVVNKNREIQNLRFSPLYLLEMLLHRISGDSII